MGKNMKKKGVTLIELLIVVLILGALAAIALPRISQSATTAKQNACATNIDVINSAIELYNANESAYPSALTDVTGNTDYFPDGAPTCPLEGTYTMSGTTNRISCDH